MKLETLFGGAARFATIEALSETRQPVTAHQIAITKGLDPAATYRIIAEFLDYKIVESIAGNRNQTFYRLSDGPGKAAAMFLQSLKQKTPMTIDLEEWMSQEMQAKRIEKIPRLDKKADLRLRNSKSIDKLLSKRIPGELSALVISARLAFNEMFEQKNDMFILKS